MDNSFSSIAIVGATGAVGREIIDVLHRRSYPVEKLALFASERSAGQTLDTPFGKLTVRPFAFDEVRAYGIVFLAVSGDFAKAHAPALAQAGCHVIDNSSAFRYDKDIPLVVPEVNADALRGGSRLIANPNCTTAILVLALEPLRQAFGLKKVIVSTYQASSGAGAKGMDELHDQACRYSSDADLGNKVFPYQLLFNVIPQIDTFQDNGYTREEMKVVWESRKIMGLPDLAASCTAVRVPTLRVHAESVTIETERPVTAEAARAVLAAAPGVAVTDTPAEKKYPMPITSTGKFDVEVGRIRANPVFGACGLDFFICGDQLLKGAALNAVQIAECLAQQAADTGPQRARAAG